MKNLYILILLFFSYSILGWIMEVIVSLIKRHKFIDRGFLIGPICPIYGFGGCLILILLTRYQDDALVLFIMSVLLCSILEYFTSYLMEKIFKNRWWDYSDKKFNLNGRICLECSIPFGLGAIFIIYVLNPIFISTYSLLNLNTLMIISTILIIVFIIDLTASFNIIVNLKHISSNIKSDSTEIITKKVRSILLEKNYLFRRLVDSFPKMQIYNKMLLINKRIEKDKKEFKKLKIQARKNLIKKKKR